MFAQQQPSSAPAQYHYQTEFEQPQPQGSEDMFFALERLLMGITPFPPSMPTLAKPTCPPSLDDQIMAEIQITSSSSPLPASSIPSIVLNEQSLDLLQQQFNSSSNNSNNFQHYDTSDCSSTSRSTSPPSSPYSYTSSSLVSSPAVPLVDYSHNMASETFWNNNGNNASSAAIQSQDWEFSLFDQMNMSLTMTGLENCIASPATDFTFLGQPQNATTTLSTSPSRSLKQATSAKKAQHSHRRTSSSCSAISAYQSTASRSQRASSISSVCSVASTTSTSTSATTTTKTRPVKSYACSTCTKPFPTRTQLKSHMAIHTDLFPFPCLEDGCELHFKRKHDLRRHVDAKHALVKKYLCTGGCGEGFGRRDQMVRHLRRGSCGQGFQTD
ncbi:hypothetical protein BGZ98_005308 [Dissophora globulifera]|nr:hypothetical protein BGZ98_005308 [Dissophora globulifera]